jgi:hypothetical protein
MCHSDVHTSPYSLVMGLIKLSAEFRRRIDRASGHSNTIPELCTLHTNPAFDQVSEFLYVWSTMMCAVTKASFFLVFTYLDGYLHSTNLPRSRNSYSSLTLCHIVLFNIAIRKSSRPKEIHMSAPYITMFTDTPQAWSSAGMSRTEFLYRVRQK